MRVSLEQVDAYLKQKTKRETCPFCDCTDWELMAAWVDDTGQEVPSGGELRTMDVILNAYIDRMKERNALEAQIFVPSFMLTCHQCGFVRLHSMPALEKWVEEQ